MKSLTLSDQDLRSISKLTGIGLSFVDAIALIENKNNRLIFENIRNDLEKGMSVTKSLSLYLNNYLKNHFTVFSNCLSFQKSISLSLTLYDEHNKLLKLLVNKLIYPVGLFLVSFIGIYIFNNYFFDSLMLTLNSFTDNLGYLHYFKNAIDVIIYVFLLISLIIFIVVLYFLKPKNYILGYSLLCKYFKNNILKRYMTNELIIYFKEMYKEGLKTKQIFENLKRIKNNPVLASLSSRINDHLNDGLSFKEAMENEDIDKSFNHFIVLIDKSTDVFELLEDYYIINEDFFISLINKFTKAVQAISYSMIIIFIFFIYQIILSPLNMMASI